MSQQQPINILKRFKDFFACKNVLALNLRYPGNIQRIFRLQNCLSRKLSKDWKYSTTFSPAKISQQQPIIILKKFKDFSACKNVLAATHQYSEKIQRIFCLQNVLALNHRYPGNFQRLFRLQICRSRKSSISWKYSKTFSAAKMSQQQPVNILKIFKDFFACKIVLAANHRFPGNFQRLFRLQKCLSSNPSII